VEWNVLATVHAANGDRPLEVYRFLRDELRARFLQFIPVVERTRDPDTGRPGPVAAVSVRPGQYGAFLNAVFDEWVRADVGRIHVGIFDATLAAWIGRPGELCTLAPTCGTALVLEHNGDLYACDHFVDPEHRLGNILRTPLIELATADRQRRFGRDKRDRLARRCLECAVRFACHGDCPKHRFRPAPDGEPGPSYLCDAYRAFFSHVAGPMAVMADLLRRNRAPAEIMQHNEVLALGATFAAVGRNDACPCGSGRKFKRCHGRSRSA
jgi:uncharacterized protein